MASEWVKFRDRVVNSLNAEEVTEEVKQRVSKAVVENVFPAIEDTVSDFVAEVKKQSVKESGWCWIRDAFVLPLVLEGSVFFAKFVLTKSLKA